MKVTLDVDPASLDKAVIKTLEQMDCTLRMDMVSNACVFHKDKSKDKRIIKKHLEAIDLILKYLGK